MSMKKWSSPAKLNLFLYITGRRADNYHNLQTLFQFIDLCDYLTFETRQDNQIKLVTAFEHIKQDDNLIIKSAKLLLDHVKRNHIQLPKPFGMNISIDKKLPMGGGLGGGSSNAATTLIALNHFWRSNLSTDTLMKIGHKIGADVAIFVFGYNAFAQGIGDNLQPINLPQKWYLIVKPNIEISTASIFKHAELKRDTVSKDLKVLLTTPFKNDCEAVVRKLYPTIDRLIRLLSTKAPTRLTGTGSCIFCECASKDLAQELQRFLQQETNQTDGIMSFIAKGLNHSPLILNKLKSLDNH